MKVKVNELTDLQIDWVGAKIQALLGRTRGFELRKGVPMELDGMWDVACYSHGSVKTEELMIQEKITVGPSKTSPFKAFYGSVDSMVSDLVSDRYVGPTPQIALMRCFIAKHLGNEIEVPDELVIRLW